MMGHEYNENVFSVHNPSIHPALCAGGYLFPFGYCNCICEGGWLHVYTFILETKKTGANPSSSIICGNWSNIYRHVSIRT